MPRTGAPIAPLNESRGRMTDGQTLSIWSIRISLALFFIFAALALSGWMRGKKWRWMRLLWTLAVIAYGVHVITAFAFFHDWSHARAVEHTAAITEKYIGMRWGGGLYFNHLFSVVCLVETLWWWASPRSYEWRTWWLGAMVYAYLIFIIVNASIVFVSGPMRWISAVATAALVLYALALWPGYRHRAPGSLDRQNS